MKEPQVILDAHTDDEVWELLTAELQARVPAELHDDLDAFVAVLEKLPDGLRAMAATYQLDVSLTLDDLGWHFGNWHHHGYSLETARGLRVLGATREAELFEAGYAVARRYWNEMGSALWMEWYNEDSPMERETAALSDELWKLAKGGRGLLGHWISYARRNPRLLLEAVRAGEQ
jgi:hypothetical protein